MIRPPSIALILLGVLTSYNANAQLSPPQPIVHPNLSYAPRPNGAFACYADRSPALSPFSPLPNLTGRDLSGLVLWSNRMTNDMCRASCGRLNFAYAGTQSGTFCFCGDNAGSIAASAAPSCSSPCFGSPGEMCGGQAANSVSKTSFIPPPAPPLPANGGQCVMDASAPGYRHYEIQTWTVTGRTNQSGTEVFTMAWSSIGAGAYHEPPSATNVSVRSWIINGGASVTFQAKLVPATQHLVFSAQARGSAPLTETQIGVASGAEQPAITLPPSNWGEFQVPEIDVPPASTTPAMPAQNIVITNQKFLTQTYSAPAGTLGNVTCNWRVML